MPFGAPPQFSPAQICAQRILRAANILESTTVSAIAPSVGSDWAATTLSSPVVTPPTSPVMTPMGGQWIYNAAQSFYQGGLADGGAAVLNGGPGMGLRFATNTRYFDFGVLDDQANRHFRVRYREVGGVWTWLSAGDYNLPGTSFASRFYKYDLGSAKTRVIEIYFSAFCAVYEVNIPAPYKIWKAPKVDMPRGLVISDSYGAGSTGATSYPALAQGAWPTAMGVAMGAEVISSSLGGVGYLNAGAYKTARQRIADVSRFGIVDFLVVALGANDAAANAAALTTEVGLYAAAVKAAQPKAMIMAVGPWRAPNLNPSAAINNAVAAGWAPYLDNRTFYFDLFAESLQTITAGGDFASGGIYVAPDLAHPNDEGQNYIGRWMADRAIATASTVVG